MDLTASFRYLSPAARLYAGVDALSNLYREAQRLEATRAFVVCSETVARTTNLLERTKESLGDLYAGVFDGAKRESPIPSVMAGVEAAQDAQADMIVAVGGGSAVVTARAITILMAEDGTPQELCTKYPPGQPPVSPRLLQPKVPNILVLTTPTNGANRGGAAVMDDKPPYRLEMFDPKARPTCIILDGEALLTAPLPLFLDTASNTFTAVVGGLQSPGTQPLRLRGPAAGPGAFAGVPAQAGIQFGRPGAAHPAGRCGDNLQPRGGCAFRRRTGRRHNP